MILFTVANFRFSDWLTGIRVNVTFLMMLETQLIKLKMAGKVSKTFSQV